MSTNGASCPVCHKDFPEIEVLGVHMMDDHDGVEFPAWLDQALEKRKAELIAKAETMGAAQEKADVSKCARSGCGQAGGGGFLMTPRLLFWPGGLKKFYKPVSLTPEIALCPDHRKEETASRTFAAHFAPMAAKAGGAFKNNPPRPDEVEYRWIFPMSHQERIKREGARVIGKVPARDWLEGKS